MNTLQIVDKLDCFAEEFKHVDLSEKKIKQAEFEECTFISCNFTQTFFHACRFIDCRFVNCNFSLAKLTDSIISGSDFVSSKMIGIDWTMCDHKSLLTSEPLSFVECILNDGNFFGLQLDHIRMKKCTLRDLDFRSGSFVRADFSQSDFKGALFGSTNLEYANFTDATNTQIDMQSNKLKGAIFNKFEALYMLESMGIILVD